MSTVGPKRPLETWTRFAVLLKHPGRETQHTLPPERKAQEALTGAAPPGSGVGGERLAKVGSPAGASASLAQPVRKGSVKCVTIIRAVRDEKSARR